MLSKDLPLVSVVMNCYNSDKYLQEAIDSVYIQSYSNWEIVFWDNASTDNSGSIVKSYDERIKYYLAPETTPLGEARNLALKEVSGQYIAFLDCDDVYLPDKLERQVKLMESKDYAMCYGSVVVIDENGGKIRQEPANYKSGYIFGNLLKRYEIIMSSAMIRCHILKENDLSFLHHLRYCPDHNFFMEIASRFSVGVVPNYILKYRIVSNSLSKKTLHLVSTEIQYTLDHILGRKPEIRSKYPNSVKMAYSKLSYYDAINYISQDNFKDARKVLKIIRTERWQYMVLYFLLLLPISSSRILRLLKR